MGRHVPRLDFSETGAAAWVLYFDLQDTSFYREAKAAQTSIAQIACRLDSLGKQRGRPLRGEDFVGPDFPSGVLVIGGPDGWTSSDGCPQHDPRLLGGANRFLGRGLPSLSRSLIGHRHTHSAQLSQPVICRHVRLTPSRRGLRWLA